jgi:predicted XRE-type DNA-binding protein
MSSTGPIQDIAVEEGSGNPYADLGLPQADEMLAKAGLAHKITQMIEDRNLTQLHAAELLGMQQSTLSDLLRGNFRAISQARMIEYLNRLSE